MPRITRRNLLTKTSMGVAAAGMVAAVPGFAKLRGSGAPAGATGALAARKVTAPQAGGAAPSVVYVRNAAKGEVVLMMGTKQVVRTDPGLVSYLSKLGGNVA